MKKQSLLILVLLCPTLPLHGMSLFSKLTERCKKSRVERQDDEIRKNFVAHVHAVHRTQQQKDVSQHVNEDTEYKQGVEDLMARSGDPLPQRGEASQRRCPCSLKQLMVVSLAVVVGFYADYQVTSVLPTMRTPAPEHRSQKIQRLHCKHYHRAVPGCPRKNFNKLG